MFGQLSMPLRRHQFVISLEIFEGSAIVYSCSLELGWRLELNTLIL